MANKEKIKATAYLRTSSATNTGQDKDSGKRQRSAIEAFAKRAGYKIDPADFFYDEAVSGADPIETREGFNRLLDRIEGNGVRVVIVEDASRFARDLMTQELGILSLILLGVKVITASGDDLTASDDPMKVAMRQFAGVFAQLEKARLVAKLKGARERKKAETGKCGGRKSHAEKENGEELLAAARALNDGRSLMKISDALAEQGFRTSKGNPFSGSAVKSMLGTEFAGNALKRTTKRGRRVLNGSAK